MGFTKATKKQAKGRMGLIGVSGSGKTWTSLTVATILAGPTGKIAVIDSENGSASKYADTFDFDTMNLESFTPKSYVNAIHEAEEGGYDVVIIDSLSHAWAGKDGVLALVDNATARSGSKNAFTSGWREVTPQHNELVDALVRCKCHLIVTMRSKTDWVIEDTGGKKIPRKIGLAPVQREGMEYELDVVGDMDMENTLVITKSRCPALAGGVFRKPGEDFANKFRDWLKDGEPLPATDTPGPVEQRSILLSEAFDAQGATTQERGKLTAGVCKKKKVSRITDLSDEDWKSLLEFIHSGGFRKQAAA